MAELRGDSAIAAHADASTMQISRERNNEDEIHAP
jgi:hypothetical protein